MPCPRNPCCHPCYHPCYNNTCTCSNSTTGNHNQQQQQQQQLLQALTTILFPSPPPPPPIHSIPIAPLYSSFQYQQQQYHHRQQQLVQKQQEEEQDALHSLHQRIVALESQLLQPHHHYYQNPKTQQEEVVNSLLERIAALESTQPLDHPPKQPRRRRQPQPTVLATRFSVSLRDLAARTIQVAFRRFLVRRSQTLRYLKDLAVIKSRVAALKPALSSGKDRRRDPRAVSQAAMDLIVQLESIQSGDPMIREGKRSIGRELSRIMDFIDKFMLKEHHYDETDEDFILNDGNRSVTRERVKRVSFSDNSKGLGNNLFEEGYCDASGEHNGYVDSLDEGFAGVHLRERLEELQHVSDDDRSSESSSVENGGRNVSAGNLKMHSMKRGLSVPMPAQMEPRKN